MQENTLKQNKTYNRKFSCNVATILAGVAPDMKKHALTLKSKQVQNEDINGAIKIIWCSQIHLG